MGLAQRRGLPVKNLHLIWKAEKECPSWHPSVRKCVLPGHVAVLCSLPKPQGVCSEVLGLRPKDRAARRRHFSQEPLEGAQSEPVSGTDIKTRPGCPIPTSLDSWSWDISLYENAGSQKGTTDTVTPQSVHALLLRLRPSARTEVCKRGQKLGP